MHLRGLDLNLLVVLNTLLEEKNITRTGRRIYLSQSATSGALARLREFFGDELLVQIGHKMVLTPLAESLTLPVRDLLIHAQAIIDQKPNFDPASSTRDFRVMMSDYMASVLMTPVAARLQAIAPTVQVRILPMADSPEEKLERGEIDLLILPDKFLSDAHPSRELFQDTYVCLAWIGNKTTGNELTTEQYFSSTHVAVRFGTQVNDSLEEWIFQKTGRVRQMRLTTHSYALIPQLLVSTDSIATVHQKMAELYAQWLPVKIVPPPFEMPQLVERIQWHQFRDKDPGIVWLRKLLRKTAKEVGGVPRQRSASAHASSDDAIGLAEGSEELLRV